MRTGLVSIIMASYNSSEFIGKTIDSIRSQTYENWELLITDDCSTDNSIEVINRYVEEDSRIKLLQLDKNQGAAVARNNSIANASGRYLAFCDSDDLWTIEKLEKQIGFMSKNNVTMTYTSYIISDADNNPIGLVVCHKTISYRQLLRDNKINFSTLVYDTKIVGRMFLPLIKKRHDWAYYLLILKKCSVAYGIIETLAYYPQRNNSLSSGNRAALIKYNLMVYRDVLGYSTVKTWGMFIFVYMPSYIIKKLRNMTTSYTW